MQRKAQLALLAEQRRLEATWLAMLAHPLLTLQLVQTRASQSLQPLVDLVPRLTILLQLISFAYPCQSITGEATSDRLLILDGEYSESFLHCIRHRLTPQIAKTLVAKCSELIGFPTLFSVSAVADRDELQGYVMPLCTREAIQAGLKNCSDLLLYFSTVFRSISFGFNKSFPRTAAAASPLIPLSGDTDVATQGPIYAAHRIGDLLRFVQQVDTAGSGMISQEVLCLYQTLHRGATSFDLLAVDEYKNWQIFADNFDKTLVLKFVTEEPVKYSAPAIPVAAPAPPAPAAAASSTPTLSSESGVTQRVVADEERAILSSRVTVLTAELAECRQLLAIMTKELDQSQRAVKEAQELNLTLLMEMQRSNIMRSVGEVGATDLPTRYQALVEAIASDGQQ
jgi:hypothetical protein